MHAIYTMYCNWLLIILFYFHYLRPSSRVKETHFIFMYVLTAEKRLWFMPPIIETCKSISLTKYLILSSIFVHLVLVNHLGSVKGYLIYPRPVVTSWWNYLWTKYWLGILNWVFQVLYIYVISAKIHLSYGIASWSDISPCIKTDKSLVLYRFCNVI